MVRDCSQGEYMSVESSNLFEDKKFTIIFGVIGSLLVSIFILYRKGFFIELFFLDDPKKLAIYFFAAIITLVVATSYLGGIISLITLFLIDYFYFGNKNITDGWFIFYWALLVLAVLIMDHFLSEVSSALSAKCPNCKAWAAYLLSDDELVNSWQQWETRTFNDETRNREGKLISTTTRRQQVMVNYQEKKYTYKCESCGFSDSFNKTHSWVN
jgi:hypothetical protein